MLGAPSLYNHSPVEDRKFALVVGNWRNHRPGHDDQIHHRLFDCRNYRGRPSDTQPALPDESLVVVWCFVGVANMAAQSNLAISESLDFTLFPGEHSHRRCTEWFDQ